MDNLHFKTNVQIKSIIGKDLINDDNIAILELVKNSFDADAKRVNISFCNLKNNDDKKTDSFSEKTSRLFICDDGLGMDLTDINEKWLNIAYSEKKTRTRQYNRMMAGAKGVGRFSCDRLGQFLRLYAKKSGEPCIVLNIDWRKFEVNDKTKEIQSIEIEYETLDNKTMEQRGFHSFEHGVILEIIKLRSNWVYPESSGWDTDKLTELKKYLEKLINPNQAFEKNDFGIYLNAEEFLVENSHKALNNRFIGKVENTIFQKLDFKTTSIECKSIENGKLMLTTLKDKGETIYWIKELSEFYPNIQNFKITLYFLNTYAKAFFTKQTGMRSVSYGSVFLFLNGFRIPPYGEEGDDWLKLDQRRAQGYARFISARDLVGQIELLDDHESFQIVSSREGLVKNENYDKLTDKGKGLFYKVLRRLERYVVDGLNWDSIPEEDKTKISEIEKKIISGELSEKDLKYQEDFTIKRQRIYESIHTLINASPKRVVELYINEVLIESKIAEERQLAEQEFSKLMIDFESKKISGEFLAQLLQKKAKESETLEKQLKEYSKYTTNEATAKAIVEIQTYKNFLEKQANLIKSLQEQLEKKRQEIDNIRKDANNRIYEAEQKQKQAEKERDIVSQKNRYLESTRIISVEEESFIHIINVYSQEINPAFLKISEIVRLNSIPNELIKEISVVRTFFDKILNAASLLTKANIKKLAEKEIINLSEYIDEYIQKSSEILFRDICFKVINNNNVEYYGAYSLLDISVLLDNLISNAKKESAKEIQINIFQEKGKYIIDFSDSGNGVSDPTLLGDKMFELGITTRYGGSGIGLASVKKIVSDMKGHISFLGNNIYLKGATFRIEFNI
ncbi:ATP-binding protein [Prevotella histicola]|jgi:two component system sensor histidine kinase|uniref:ATP-binding protein n=1 Tax=Prevotella histicola TaxID=470565 RepID=UPI001C5F8945|nr:ATP-binding protein [Prevotella histicola]MBF1393214.1 ATP-binding protein [Prevotella histicola]MBW4740169.1 ATP-binding protein [Prevotella histicola]MBW4748450.1 ATP-binding protein [Prevotella histicola]